MKTIFGSRKYHYIARVCIFLITLALVVEMVGCSCGGGGGGGGVNYNLTISSTAGGKVTQPGEGTFTYNKGRRVDLVASPAKGYSFVNWTGNTSTIVSPTAASTKITMNGAYSITANFVAVVYNLTISSTVGGSVTPVVGTHTYNASTVVNLLATPGAGYSFVNWTGNTAAMAAIGSATAVKTTITMNGHYSITAVFVAVYDLTISSTIGGNVTTPREGTYTYAANTSVSLEATPDDHYRFTKWTGNVTTIKDFTAAKTTITMNGNYTITANFEKIPQYDLSIGCYEWYEDYEGPCLWSYVIPDVGTYTYDEGTVVYLEAVSSPLCYFAGWYWPLGTKDVCIANRWSPTTTITMWDDYIIAAVFVCGYSEY